MKGGANIPVLTVRIVRQEFISRVHVVFFSMWINEWLFGRHAPVRVKLDPDLLRANPFAHITDVLTKLGQSFCELKVAELLLPVEFQVYLEPGGYGVYKWGDRVVSLVYGELWPFVCKVWGRRDKQYGIAEVDDLISNFFTNQKSPP